MKKIHLFVLSILLMSNISCITSKGNWDSNNTSKDPYTFIYNGSIKDMTNSIKRILILQGYSIDNDDLDAGFLTTKPKVLNDDEKIDMGLAMAMMGTHVRQQTGIISFIYEKIDNNRVQLKMICKLKMHASYSENAFKDKDLDLGVNTLSQGHPLSMKLKTAILNNKKFILGL